MKIYSAGFDYNYIRPDLAILLCVSEYLYLYRNPYNTLITVQGHFKQTQVSAFIEAGLNIVLSLIFVNIMGVIGVAFGTAIAMLYRLIYCVVYVKKYLLDIPFFDLFKPVLLTGTSVLVVSAVLRWVDLSLVNNYFYFVVAGAAFTLLFAIIQIVLNYILYIRVKNKCTL